MKFMCLKCNQPMALISTTPREGGTMAVEYGCPTCDARMAMVTNPGETQLVNSLGVQIGHERVAGGTTGPMSVLRGALAEGQPVNEVAGTADAGPVWSEAAQRRLAAAPIFVQGMVRRLYDDWARQNGVAEITPEVMNRAREGLGLVEM